MPRRAPPPIPTLSEIANARAGSGSIATTATVPPSLFLLRSSSFGGLKRKDRPRPSARMATTIEPHLTLPRPPDAVPLGDHRTLGGHMFYSAHDLARLKRFARAVIALTFLAGQIAPSYAQGFAGSGLPQRGVTSFAGHAAMLGVRIPLGGAGTVSSRPMVGLMFGSSLRAVPGSTSAQAYRFVPTVEAGLTLRGDPILRLSSFEVRVDQLRAAAEDAGGETFCGRNPGVCIAGGIAIVAVAVVALTGGDDNCTSAPGQYPPGEDPCRCYEPDGCT